MEVIGFRFRVGTVVCIDCGVGAGGPFLHDSSGLIHRDFSEQRNQFGFGIGEQVDRFVGHIRNDHGCLGRSQHAVRECFFGCREVTYVGA